MLCSSGIMKLYFNTSTEKHFWGWKQTKSVMFSSVKLNHVCSPHRRSVQRGFHPVTVTHHPWTWDKFERPCAALWQEAPHFFYSHTSHLLSEAEAACLEVALPLLCSPRQWHFCMTFAELCGLFHKGSRCSHLYFKNTISSSFVLSCSGCIYLFNTINRWLCYPNFFLDSAWA